VKQREAAIVGLHRELESMQQQHEAQLEAGEARLAYAVDQQRQEYEANIARHLGFIDRLLADKDELSKSCSNLMEQVQALQQKQVGHPVLAMLPAMHIH
jgi:5-azacytidine-induced protein 1